VWFVGAFFNNLVRLAGERLNSGKEGMSLGQDGVILKTLFAYIALQAIHNHIQAEDDVNANLHGIGTDNTERKLDACEMAGKLTSWADPSY
jgi:hypothetical protein